MNIFGATIPVEAPTCSKPAPKPGLSLLDAETLFKHCECNHYFMFRHDEDVYATYKKLRIPKEQEIQWAKEALSVLFERLIDDATPQQRLWAIYSSATNMTESLKDNALLQELCRVSFQILEKIPEGECIMCSESILDRRDVSLEGGVIFLSMNLGEPELAMHFLELADKFTKRYGRYEEREIEREKHAFRRAETISSMISARRDLV